MTDPIQRYHQNTLYDPLKMSGHSLDWANQPSVYKDYPGVGRVELPELDRLPDTSFSDLLRTLHDTQTHHQRISLKDIAWILFLGYGITARRKSMPEDFYYRSVPSAGALYPCELYMAAQSIDGLSDGLYHYAIHRRELHRLRDGIHTTPKALSAFQQDISFSVTFYITAIFYRSIWKYRDRAYRYHLLDTGHLVESLVLAVRSQGLSCEVTYDFDDAGVNHLLGVDGDREACLAVVGISEGGAGDEAMNQPIERLSYTDASRVSPREDVPEAIRRIHVASSHVDASSDRHCDVLPFCGVQPQQWHSLDMKQPFEAMMNFPQAVVSRRSRRNFVPGTLSLKDFISVMQMLLMADSGRFQPFHFIACGVIVGFCEDLDAGAYWVDPVSQRIGRFRSGRFSAEMADIALNQKWMASAGLQFFFGAPFSETHALWGPRAYRYAMISAGRLAHRIYIGATALGLGCCGIGAFYDRDAAALLGLDSRCDLLYLVAAGPIKHLSE
jgi:SagB-type dehydrogenase family enzyme